MCATKRPAKLAPSTPRRATSLIGWAQPDDLRETVIVDATDYWKWIGTHINHPNTGHRVMVRDVQRAHHPKDGREIVAIVPENGPLVFSERTGHLVFEDN